MPVIRCTKRLLTYSKRSAVATAPSPEGLFGEWYANAISMPFPGKWLVLYTHPQTRISVVVAGRSLNTTVHHLKDRFAGLLTRLGVPDRQRQDACSSLNDEVIVARTNSRSVIGTQTDYGHTLRYLAGRASSMDEVDLAEMEDCMARTPIIALKLFPRDAVYDTLGIPRNHSTRL
ncbi:DUF6933 domain-containing protein [Longibacter sp.]|uniref:DUF6933 domain-containing protein n=1 Tax=Longibacter sp. TaxID=2045415 RepID=UPI003EBCA330